MALGPGRTSDATRCRRPVVACAALLLFTSPAAAQTPEAPAGRSTTWPRCARSRDPQVSPDGKWVAYVVGTQDAEKDKRDSDLWMVSWDGKEQVRLTSSAETSESAPRWSPDGRYLAFLSARGDEDEKKKGAQVWLLDRQGGEAQKLTDIKGGVSDYAWSPDGKRLCLVVNDFDPTSDPEKMEGWKRKTAPPIVIDRYHFKSDQGGYLRRLYSHLTLFDVDSKKAEMLTQRRVRRRVAGVVARREVDRLRQQPHAGPGPQRRLERVRDRGEGRAPRRAR